MCVAAIIKQNASTAPCTVYKASPEGRTKFTSLAAHKIECLPAAGMRAQFCAGQTPGLRP